MELGQLGHEAVGRLVVGLGNGVVSQRTDDAVAGGHSRDLHNGCKGDAVDAHQRRELHGEFTQPLDGGVDLLEAEVLVLVEERTVFAGAGAQAAAGQVGSVDQAADGIKGRGFGVVPA